MLLKLVAKDPVGAKPNLFTCLLIFAQFNTMSLNLCTLVFPQSLSFHRGFISFVCFVYFFHASQSFLIFINVLKVFIRDSKAEPEGLILPWRLAAL